MSAISNYIRDYLSRERMTQEQFAEKSQIRVGRIRWILQGGRLRPGEDRKIDRAMGIDLSEDG